MTLNKKKLKSEVLCLTDEMYRECVLQADKVMSFSEKEKNILSQSPVARFMAEIPWITNQKTPEVVAAMNLISYVAGGRNKNFFAHRPGQSLRERIIPYIHGFKEDQDVFSLCLDVLEEVSLHDHFSDKDQDRLTGHSNPINNNEIDFKVEQRRLKLKRESYSDKVKNLVEGRWDGDILCWYWLY